MVENAFVIQRAATKAVYLLPCCRVYFRFVPFSAILLLETLFVRAHGRNNKFAASRRRNYNAITDANETIFSFNNLFIKIKISYNFSQSDVLFDILSIDWSFYNFKVNIILQKKKSPNNQIYSMRLWLIYIVESFWQQIIFRFYFKAKFLFE